MPSRRAVLRLLGFPAVASLVGSCSSSRLVRALEPFEDGVQLDPQALARDESRWTHVQNAFDVDRSVVNLNNGGCCPSPRSVLEAQARRIEFSNLLPTENLWRRLLPQRESVRAALAETFGAGADEVAVTRNASESLETCLFGLDLAPGDEVLTTDQDYPRMLTALDQRRRREGLEVVRLALPTPCEDDALLTRLFEERITERTRLILISHVINLTGQVLPVRAIVQRARARGVPVVVDGAHAFAHLVFVRDELDCDYYGASLHKWLCAAHGTGLLYVRRERIGGLWPLLAAPESMNDDIRKFEEIGTHPLAIPLSVAEALVFHHGIGAENKLARLRYLRQRWVDRLREVAGDQLVLRTSLSPRHSAGFATFHLEGRSDAALQRSLWERDSVLTSLIAAPHPECTRGLRVTPNVYTTLDELERFCAGVERCLREGVGA